MRPFHFLFIFVFTLASCLQDDTSDNETGSKQTEQNPKERQISIDTTVADTPANTLNVETIVTDIRMEFNRINSLPITTKKYKFVCDTEGTITSYSENGKVVKVAIDWGLIGDASSVSEYYYKNGKLIFVHEVHIGGPAGEPETTTEERTYVNNDKTIKYLRGQKVLPCTTCQFNESSRAYKVVSALANNNMSAALCN